MAILSKPCKPDNFESHSYLKLSFTNVQGICSNFADWESFLESNSPDIFPLCDTNLDASIDSSNLSVIGYVPLIWKDSSTYMHGSAVYVKEGLPFAWKLSLENSADSYLCFWLALLHSVSYLFFLYWLPSLSLSMVFDTISSKIDKVLSINPSANAFVFGDFNVHYRDWVIYSDGTDRSGELYYNFYNLLCYNQMTLFRWLTFLLGSQTVILTVLLFWIYLFLMMLFAVQWLSLHCLSFHWLSIICTTGCPISLHCLWLFLCWLGHSLWSFETCSMGGYP